MIRFGEISSDGYLSPFDDNIYQILFNRRSLKLYGVLVTISYLIRYTSLIKKNEFNKSFKSFNKILTYFLIDYHFGVAI